MTTSTRTDVDVVVIGCGPSGLMAADRLAADDARVLLLDAGRAHPARVCPVDKLRACHGCQGCCNVISGFGGSVHYGDGVKLSRFPSGRRLAELLGSPRAERLSDEALSALCGSAPPNFRGVQCTSPFVVKDFPVASLTSEAVRSVVDALYERLTASPLVELRLGAEVVELRPATSGWTVVVRQRRMNDQEVTARSVVVAVGRRGRAWWHSKIRALRLEFVAPAPSVGVRFECPAPLLRRGAEVHEDFKTTLVRAGVKTKTFCFCSGRGGGRIKFTDYGDYTLLDGHVVPEPVEGGPANFALLAQLRDENGRPWDMARIESDLLAAYRGMRADRPGKPVLQWFPDFKATRLDCSTLEEFMRRSGVLPSVRDYRMANLASILPPDVHTALLESFTELMDFFTDGANPAAYERQVGVIGLELENTWDELVLTPGMETSAPSLYAVGDCTGLAQGIVQAAVGGLAAAEDILTRTSVSKGIAG